MKNHIRAAIFVGVLSSLLTGYGSSAALAETDSKCVTHPHVKHVKPAHAKSKTHKIISFSEKARAAQMRLTDLGYFVGSPDGKIGPKTKTALKSFQRMNHLKATGQLNDTTFETLCMTDYLAHHYYLASVTDPKGKVFQASAPYNRPGHINPENGAWVVRGSDR